MELLAGAKSMMFAVSSTAFSLFRFLWDSNFHFYVFQFYLYVGSSFILLSTLRNWQPAVDWFGSNDSFLFIQRSSYQDQAMSWTELFSRLLAFSLDSGDVLSAVYRNRSPGFLRLSGMSHWRGTQLFFLILMIKIFFLFTTQYLY